MTLFGCVSSVDESSTNTDTVDEEPFYAWDFTINTLAGESITLSEQRDQWIVVNFWATWCAPCRAEMPELQAIHDNNDDVTVLAINQRESSDIIQAYVDELSITFPILINPPDKVLTDYQVINLPQTFIVNPEGELVWRAFGPVTVDKVEDVLRQ